MSKPIWKTYEITCAVCGIVVRKTARQKTCSMKCRELLRQRIVEASSPTAQCPFCGEIRKLVRTARGTKVCSARCKAAIWSRYIDDLRRGQDVGLRWRGPINSHQKCRMCDVVFSQKKSNHLYCSSSCADKWAFRHGTKGENLRAKNNAIRQMRDEGIGRCTLCNVPWSEIVTPKSLGSRKRYGTARFHDDHIVPKARGGVVLRPLCWFCNIAKSDMDPQIDFAIAAAGRAFWAAIHMKGESVGS